MTTNSSFNKHLVQNLSSYLSLYVQQERLKLQVANLTKTAVSWENPDHAKTLSQLLKLCLPDSAPIQGPSDAWKGMGFQGNDPCTDFRGMGMLGLFCLHHMALHHQKEMHQMIQDTESGIAVYYPVAVAGINVLAQQVQLLRNGDLTRTLAFVQTTGSQDLSHFAHIFAALFHSFHVYWKNARPASMMDFNTVLTAFTSDLPDRLKSGLALLEQE